MNESAAQPLVIAYHLMWTLYGWWLPNDPRGSTSNTVRNFDLSALGELHRGRKMVQPSSAEIRTFYAAAAENLEHDLLTFSPEHFATVADAIAGSVAKHKYTCYACAVMPDHVHILIRKHRDSAERMIENLQFDSLGTIRTSGLRPMRHPVWTRGGWKVFLDHPDDVWRTIRYIEMNPLRQRLPQQKWPFVKVYDNWRLHEGHSPWSPYAKALRRAGRYPR